MGAGIDQCENISLSSLPAPNFLGRQFLALLKCVCACVYVCVKIYPCSTQQIQKLLYVFVLWYIKIKYELALCRLPYHSVFCLWSCSSPIRYSASTIISITMSWRIFPIVTFYIYVLLTRKLSICSSYQKLFKYKKHLNMCLLQKLYISC